MAMPWEVSLSQLHGVHVVETTVVWTSLSGCYNLVVLATSTKYCLTLSDRDAAFVWHNTRMA